MRIRKTAAWAQTKYPKLPQVTSTKPMKNPPKAAPVRLPMPPRTAAVNAFRPAWKPRL